MTATTPESPLARFLRFERGLAVGAGAATVQTPLGPALLHAGFPGTFVLNELRVTRSAAELPSLRAEDLIRAADAALDGLAHRRIAVEDDALGERVASGIRDAGWTAERHVVMVLARERDRAAAPGVAHESPEAQVREIEALGADPGIGETDEWVRGERPQAFAALAAAGNARFVTAALEGAPSSCATLYRGDRIAQVESVQTLEPARNNGLARAVVSLAIDLALEDEPELVMISADADDTPRELYAKLGFDPVGASWVLTRMPAT